MPFISGILLQREKLWVRISEYVGSTNTAEYIRGSDWGGGVGGLLYSVRAGVPSFKHYNSRGDVITETNGSAAATWQASYEAFGTRTQEVGSTQDRQKANTKEEDPTGLLNEGFRYRDLATGSFITRDPLGFVDGPNMYAYVVQNPWSKFDPEGLNETWGGNNWFANWVLPDPVSSIHDGSHSAEQAFGGRSGWDKAGGVAGTLGYGVSAVIDLVPGVGKIKREIVEHLGEAAAKKIAAATEKKIAEAAVEKAGTKVESTAKNTLEKSEQTTEKAAADGAQKETGSYTNYHESGKTYDGKGGKARSQTSAKRIEKETGDTHVATEWTPAENTSEAFKQESKRLDSHGGPKAAENHNKIESPGKKLREKDGE